MGHVLLKGLPKSRTWQKVTSLVSNGADVEKVADATIRASEKALTTAQHDTGFREAVHILSQLAVAASKEDPAAHLAKIGVHIPKDTSLPEVIVAITDAMDRRLAGTKDRSDFGEMAQRSLVRAVTQHMKARLPELFAPSEHDVRAALQDLRKKKAFGELSRSFFSHVSNEFMGYFLSKTMSSHIGEGQAFATTNQVTQFQQAMKTHCDESSVVVEQYSGDWFSKHRFEEAGDISRESADGFGWYALEKMRSAMLTDPEQDAE